jgi:PAS domain S-box-containing protein
MSHSKISPTSNKVGVAFTAGEADDKFSTTVSSNLLQQNTSGNHEQSTSSKGNILVVDDTPANLNALIKMLSEQGYNVIPVSCGKLVLMAVQSILPDLILLDIRMPEMDGYQVCSQLKASSHTKDIPIIFLSALDAVVDRAKVFSIGGADYITKPFQIEEVLARIENQLRIQRLTQPVIEQNVQLIKEVEERKIAQEKLKQSEKRYRQLFEGSVDGIVMVDLEGRIIDSNASYQKMLGYSLEELKSLKCCEMTPIRWHEWEAEIINQQVIERGYSDTYEKEYIKKDGTVFPVELTAYCQKNDAGQPEMMWAVVRDISDRKRTEEALQQSKERWQLVVKAINAGIWDRNLKTGEVFHSPRWKEMLGYKDDEIENTTEEWNSRLHPDDADYVMATTQAHLNKKTPYYSTEYRLLCKDGSYKWILSRGLALWDEQGNPVRFVGSHEDITERKIAEQKLRDTTFLYQQILDAIPDFVLCKGSQSRIIYANKAFRDYYGMTLEQLYGIIDAPFVKPDYTQQYVKDDAYVFNTGQMLTVEEAVVRYDGQERLFSTVKSAIFDAQGQVIQTVGVSRDITERKQAEEALQQSKAQFRQKVQELELTLNELKRTQAQLIHAEKMSSLGQMIAGIAHEINNPIGFIYGNLTPARHYCENLLELIELYRQTYPHPTLEIQQLIEKIDLDFLVDDWQKLMNSMQVGAERICEIVHSLRNFSRLNEKELKPVDIHEGIENTLLILQHRLRAVGDRGLRKEIRVIKEYGQLPKVTCYASQLNQVFMNLLSNAIDAIAKRCCDSATRSDSDSAALASLRASERASAQIASYYANDAAEKQASQGVITVRTEVVSGKEQQTTDFVVIRIADNGSGMSEEVRQKIFDPFFTTKAVGSGTGLGLSISYQIVVEKHGGQLSCISDPGRGTEFIVEIPVNCKMQGNQ